MKILAIFLIILTSCKSKVEQIFLRSEVVISGYYCDHYKVDSYGVGGDVYRLFLRDSLNKILFVCDYYDNDIFEYFFKGEKIEILKFEDSYSVGGIKHNKRLINKYVFDLRNWAK